MKIYISSAIFVRRKLCVNGQPQKDAEVIRLIC